MSSTVIRDLNDAFRQTFRGGKVVTTASVAALPEKLKAEALLQMSRFSDFTPDNDPHGEHDFGSFELEGRKLFWKIDYFEKGTDYMAGAETPENSATTDRLLTMMLAEEY